MCSRHFKAAKQLIVPTRLVLSPPCRHRGPPIMQHYGVNGYSLHAMNSLSAMYNLHQQAAQQAQHAPDYRPSVHALTLAERLAGKIKQ